MIYIHRFVRLNCFFVWLAMFSFCAFSAPEPMVENLNESVRNHMVEPNVAELDEKLEFYDASENASIAHKKDVSSNKIIPVEKPLNTLFLNNYSQGFKPLPSSFGTGFLGRLPSKKEVVFQPEKVSAPLLLTYDYPTMKNQESMLAPLKQPVEDTTESDLEFVDASNYPIVDFTKNIRAQDVAATDQYSGINPSWDKQYQFAKRDLSIAQMQNELSPRNPVPLTPLQRQVQKIATQRQAAAETVINSRARRSPTSPPVSPVSVENNNQLLLQPTIQGDLQSSMTMITAKKRPKLS